MKKLLYSLLALFFFLSFGSSLFGQTSYKVEHDIVHRITPDWEDGDTSEVIISIGSSTSRVPIYTSFLDPLQGDESTSIVFDDVITIPDHDPNDPLTEINFYNESTCALANGANQNTGSFTHCRGNIMNGLPGVVGQSPICFSYTMNYSRIVQLSEFIIVSDTSGELKDCEPFIIQVSECNTQQLSYALEYTLANSMGTIIEAGELSPYGLKSASFTLNLSDITNLDASGLGTVTITPRFVADPNTTIASHRPQLPLSLDVVACPIKLRDVDPIQLVVLL